MKKSCFIANNIEIDKLLKIKPITIKYAPNLYGFFEMVKENSLKDYFKRIYNNNGIILPDIHFETEESYDCDYYEILIREEPYICSYINTASIKEDTKSNDSKNNLIFWIEEDNNKKNINEISFYKIISELNSSIFENIEKIINIKYISQIIQHTEKHNPFLIEDLRKYNISKIVIKNVLINLIKSEIPVNDFESLIEKIIELSDLGFSTEDIPEIIRSLFIKKVLEKQSHNSNSITAIKLSCNVENYLVKASNSAEKSNNELENINNHKYYTINIINIFNNFASKLGYYPILICDNKNRSIIQQLILSYNKNIQVYSNKEVLECKNIKILQVIRNKDINIKEDLISNDSNLYNHSEDIKFRNDNYKLADILQLNSCFELYKETTKKHILNSTLSKDKMKTYISKLTDLSIENIILELQDKCIPTKYIINIVEDLQVSYISFINEIQPIENIKDFMLTAENIVHEIKKRYKYNIELTCKQIMLEKIYLES